MNITTKVHLNKSPINPSPINKNEPRHTREKVIPCTKYVACKVTMKNGGSEPPQICLTPVTKLEQVAGFIGGIVETATHVCTCWRRSLGLTHSTKGQ